MPDHIHIFIKCLDHTTPISKIVNDLKGFSSYSIRKKYLYLKKYKAFWAPSYFLESIGHISRPAIIKYINY